MLPGTVSKAAAGGVAHRHAHQHQSCPGFLLSTFLILQVFAFGGLAESNYHCKPLCTQVLWDAGEQDLGSEGEGKLELLSGRSESKKEKSMSFFMLAFLFQIIYF